jgi:mono/diheme cytochrome c family protein
MTRRMYILLLVALLALGLSAFAGCGDDDDATVLPEEDTTTVPNGAEPTPDDDEPLVPGALEEDASGQQIYAHACAGCHGMQGEGATAPSLAETTRSEEEIADYLRSDHREVPGLAQMSDSQIEAVSGDVAGELSGR